MEKIQRAQSFIEINERNEISIRSFSKFETITMWYNIFTGFILIIAALLSLAGFFLTVQKTLYFAALSISLSIFFIMASAVAFAQNWPEEAAREIKNELKKKSIYTNNIETPKQETSE